MLVFSIIANQGSYNQDKNSKIIINETIFCKIAENDMDAFENLYHMTHKSVYAFALSIMKNHEDAQDILQETYVKIRGAAHLYQPMGKPMAWIFTITRNLALSRLRMMNKAVMVPAEDLEDNISFSYITDKEDKLVLQAALLILDQKEREIILLHAVSGFKHREIAESLDLSLGTVLSKYRRGLGKLRKHLREQGVLL